MEAGSFNIGDNSAACEFDEPTRIRYFNNASITPLPRSSQDAISEFVKSSSVSPFRDYDIRLRLESDLKAKIASLIRADHIDDIALIANTSSGLSKVMLGLRCQPNDEVIILAEDFVSVRVLGSILRARGVCVKEISSNPHGTIDELVLEAITQRTRLVVVSSVLYSSGIIVDIEKIGRRCRAIGVLFCVDAIQHVGAMPFDVRESCCDFVVADGHKWMHGVEGLGFLYSHCEARPQLQLNELGWHSLNDQWNTDTADLSITSASRRFECGSPSYLAMAALSASLNLLGEIGIHTIHRLLSRNVQRFAQGLNESGLFSIHTPRCGAGQSGILAFKSRFCESTELVLGLKRKGIIMACRGSFVRFSPGYYSSPEGIEMAVSTAIELSKR